MKVSASSRQPDGEADDSAASYPLTGNALRAACNQTSNREPVVDFDQQAVERTARSLKERGLLRIVWSDTGRRTLKYHQILDERLGLDPDERALLTVLLLRGPQALGELRTRTERLDALADRGEVAACTADRGYGESSVEDALHDLGVRHVVIPARANPPRPGDLSNIGQRSDER